jgi:putative oxidoreductase
MRVTINRNVLLWILQGYLALFFALGSGAPKLLLPLDMIPMPIALPEWFLRFIGVCEVLGALGLVLPMLSPVRRAAVRLGLRVGPRLTVLAATCLVLLTICATIYQLLASQPGNAVFAAITGVLCAVVAIARSRAMRSVMSTAPAATVAAAS